MIVHIIYLFTEDYVMKKQKQGNPYLRGKTWTIIYYVKDEFGHRKQVRKGGYATKEEAEKDLKIYKAKAELNQIFIGSEITLKTFLVNWFNEHKKKLQPNTINGYNGIIQQHIIPEIGDIQLRNLRPSHIQNFYKSLMDKKSLSAKTVKYVHNVLKIGLNAAVDDKLIEDNPCLKVKPPKVPRYKSKILTKEQMKILLSYAKGSKYESEITLAVMLGLRRGEVLGLKFSDVDFDRHTISIERQVSTVRDDTKKRNETYYGIKSLKSESSCRVLFINSEIENCIMRKKQFVDSQKRKLGKEYVDNDLICCKENGEVLSPQTLYHAFKLMLEKCGLPDVRFHDLRHSYATLCIDLDVPIKVLSQSLGHSSIAVTDCVYADSILAKQKLPERISSAFLNDMINK